MNLPARLGKYELEEFLGGGMSHVYRARDTAIGRQVAVKILTEAGCADPEAKERFLAEARMAGNISHENIVGVYDFGEDDGRPFLVMEFLRGKDLRTAIKDGTAGDFQRRLEIALGIARAVRYIHAQKIIHRDLKPENVNISPDGAVKLMDFGISKTEGLEMTRAGYVLGTPYYMAPEQVRGDPVDARVDVYAFGILLFELLTGKKAIAGDTVERIFYAILNEPVDTKALVSAGVQQAIVDLVKRCTAKKREERPGSFGKICAALERCLRDWQSRTLAAETAGEIDLPGRYFGVEASAQASDSHERSLAIEAPLRSNRARPVLAVWIAAGLLVMAAAAWLTTTRTQPGARPPRPPAAVTGPVNEAPGRTGQHPNIALYLVGMVCVLGAGYAWMAYRKRRRGRMPADAPGVAEADSGVQATAAPGAPFAPSMTQKAAPPVPPSESGEFTRVFRTSPPLVSEAGATPAAPAPGGPAEYTQMIAVPRELAPAAGEAAKPEVMPDVTLTITACADSACIGKSLRITEFPFRIGRGGPLAFDSAISREHAEIHYRGGGFFVCDLASSNGTFVNGRQLPPQMPEPLLFGSRILLGSNTQLTFVSNELEELPDLTGRLIGGRYRLESKLFASAKSVVYIAAHPGLPRPVVVKILSPTLFHHPGYREQFEREAKMASRLIHGSIARVFDYGETEIGAGGRCSLYLVMDYLRGGNLQDRLKRDEKIGLETAAGWLETLAEGLDYIHGQQVIHGGIKPASIVFDSEDRPYLSDFAIAVTTSDAATRMVIGSPPFLAPEQWDGKPIVPATDQYSLAAVFYFAITGAHPYEGQGHPEVRKRNYMHPPAPAHAAAAQNLRPGVPEAVSQVLERALLIDAADRYPTSAEFAAEFRLALQKRPGAGRKPTVFLSYHRGPSLPLALLVKAGLEGQHGCEVFVDVTQADVAGEIPEHLARNIGRSDVFVCLLSRNTLNSEWVKTELDMAHSAGKPMVPIFQESFRHPRDLKSQPPPVQKLLRSNGAKLYDRQGDYIPAAIQKVSELIRQSIG